MSTTVYSARKILTMNPSRPQATHVAVKDGRVLVERCDAFRGNDKDVCVKEAKLAHVAALANAKVVEVNADARTEAKDDIREAKYKVEAEKCDTQTGDGKVACLKTAKALYGKP